MAPSRDLVKDDDSDFEYPDPKRRRLSGDKDASGGEVSSEGEEVSPVQVPSPQQQELSLSRISRIKKSDEALEAAPTRLAVRPADTDFKSLAVAPWLVHTLKSLSITSPTPIQQSCIPPILEGRDCIGGSRTGSGKTIAFAVPLLQKWAEDPFGIYAVVLTPTRELALQIYEQFRALGASQNLKVVLITGGTEMRPQAIALAQRPHIVVATPGRLADHIQTSGKDTVIGFSRAKAVVLDEADRLLKSGPGSMLPDLNTCLSALPPPASRLTLLFTATVTPEVRFLKSQPRNGRPPVFISEISDSASDPSDPTNGAPTLPPTLTQTYLQLPAAHKPAYLHVLLQTPSMTAHDPSIIIFTNRTTTADHLHRTFLQLDHPVTALHSALPQRQRSANLTAFRARKSRILIATDVASRGLDIPSVRYVVNYDVPRDPADYVHRVGRTARAGRDGTAITFTGPRDVELVLAIEEYLQPGGGGKMQKWEEEGVNLETRIVKGRTLKDVEEARMEALREVEQGKDVYGRRIGKGRKVRS
ncbi:ATP-dependent RNA helicase dbp8 [Cyphellophora attinorum]|uniref:RNA helicase n=1 Tax=Cyphellophora attinorum TaxID=1664694 RepID=A0A0N1P180_9EURO|nr:ATP-dependent RNA helicase dbp8 [Phialophora attinorum]KPI40225.1 ATP-dependent RNA helicase dbp8 [Phialophora attinorum]